MVKKTWLVAALVCSLSSPVMVMAAQNADVGRLASRTYTRPPLRDIALPDHAHPEGVVFDAAGNLYVTSMGRGAVYRIRPGEDRAEPFIAPGSAGLMGAQGGRIDQARGLLYVCSSHNGANPDAVRGPSALKAFSLVDGSPRGSWDLPGGASAYCNDMVVLPSGAVLVTDSLNPEILVLRPGSKKLDVWLSHPRFAGKSYALNNMALEADGRTLYVGKLDSGELLRIRLTKDERPSGEPESIKLPRRIDDPDGMALVAPGKMLICEASVEANRGRVSLLEIHGDRATLAPVVENAGLAVPTGVAIRDGQVYVAESQVATLFVPERRKEGLKPFVVRRFALPADIAAEAAH